MVVCGGRSHPSRVRVRIESQNQQLMSVRISTQKVPLFMEGLFFLFAVDLWTTMPQGPSLCCGFRCFSWLSFCSFDHSPFSHFPCSVSCVLCFHSSSYALFLTAGLMCYWTSTCGTRRVVCAQKYVLRSKRAHLWLQGPSILCGVTLPGAHIVACAPPFEAPWCGCITGLVWKRRQLLPSAKIINHHLPLQARHDQALRPWDSKSGEPRAVSTSYWTWLEGKPIVVDDSVWLRWSRSNRLVRVRWERS